MNQHYDIKCLYASSFPVPKFIIYFKNIAPCVNLSVLKHSQIPESDAFSSRLVSFDLFSCVSFTYDDARATYASNTACVFI